MNRVITLLAAGAATLVVAGPAAAQTSYPYPYAQQAYPQQGYAYPQQGYAYPQQGYAYPQQGYAYPQQGYGYPQQQGSIGAIIGRLLGNRYNVTDRTAVTQCATAAQAQAAAQYPTPIRRGQYPGYGSYSGYNSAPQAQVTGITKVERRNRGLRVTGLMSSGTAYAYGQQAYHPTYANAASDLTFRCNVNHRGVVSNLRISRNTAYRG